MTSRRLRPDDNPELIALHRLEFYKNKKMWKLSSEKAIHHKQSSSSNLSSAIERNHLNETYDLASRSERENTSVLGNDLLHMSNEIRPREAPPLPSILTPILQPSEEADATKPGTIQTLPLEINEASLVYAQRLYDTQGQNIWDNISTSPHKIAEGFRSNDDKTNIHLLGSPTSKTVNWECPPQDEAKANFQNSIFQFKNWTDSPDLQKPLENTGWTSYNQTMDLTQTVVPNNSSILPQLNNSELLPQNAWIFTESTISSKNPNCSNLILPQAPSPESLANILIPNRWQIPSKIHQNYLENKISSNQRATAMDQNRNLNYNDNLNLNRNYFQNPNNYVQQTYEEKCFSDHWTKEIDSPQLMLQKQLSQGLSFKSQCLPPPIISSGMSPPVNNNLFPAFSQTNAGLRTYQGDKDSLGLQKKSDIWINPALIANMGNTRDEEHLQEQWEIWQNCEQDWGSAVANTSSMDKYDVYPDEAEQPTLTPLDKYEEALADARRDTHECLRKLIAAYKEKEKLKAAYKGSEMLERMSIDNIDKRNLCEMICEQYQEVLSESTEFIRGAQSVPHSSEKDPDDTNDSDIAYLNTLLMCSSGRLSASRELRVATILRDLLMDEQRKQLKQGTIVNPFEYPTRDTDPYDGEIILDGSHVPHNTALLENGTSEGVIKINMGRPYRL